jgi:hypothetical protein
LGANGIAGGRFGRTEQALFLKNGNRFGNRSFHHDFNGQPYTGRQTDFTPHGGQSIGLNREHKRPRWQIGKDKIAHIVSDYLEKLLRQVTIDKRKPCPDK